MIQAVKYPTLVGFYFVVFLCLTAAKSLRWFTELPCDLIRPLAGESCFSLITVDLIMISVCFRASGGGCHGQDIIIWRSQRFLSWRGRPGELFFFFFARYFFLWEQMPSTRQAVTRLPSTSLFPPKNNLHRAVKYKTALWSHGNSALPASFSIIPDRSQRSAGRTGKAVSAVCWSLVGGSETSLISHWVHWWACRIHFTSPW